MKLGLGTVQFGLDYGVSNRDGITPIGEVREILKLADSKGIKVIDTAAVYGKSEEILGLSLPSGHAFDIITKTPQFQRDTIQNSDAELLKHTFHSSLAKLKQHSVYGLLIHNADDLLKTGGDVLWNAMCELRERCLIRGIGVSVYSGDQIDRVLEKFRIDLIQLPVNVFDQRLLQSGHLKKLKDRGIEIHSRSVFLQGLLLMDSTILPDYLKSVSKHLQRYQDVLKLHKISPVKAALVFVLKISEIDTLIVGVNNLAHLQEIVNEIVDFSTVTEIDYSHFALNDESIINPSYWKTHIN